MSELAMRLIEENMKTRALFLDLGNSFVPNLQIRNEAVKAPAPCSVGVRKAT